jgi:hypothetical protein
MILLLYRYYPFVLVGMPVVWAIGYVIWSSHTRKHRPTVADHLATLGSAVAGAFLCVCLYLGYFIEYQSIEGYDDYVCAKNIHELGHALLAYADAHDGKLPLASEWGTDIQSYLPAADRERAFHCPSAASPYSYAFNRNLSGVSVSSIGYTFRFNTVLVYETNATSINASGDGYDTDVSRHRMARIDYGSWWSPYWSNTVCAKDNVVDVGTLSATAVVFNPKE